MCGIIAMLDYSKARFFTVDKDGLYGMMLLNSMRGVHSTGMFGVLKESNLADVIKHVGHPYVLFGHPEFKNFNDRILSDYAAIVGHGRYATQGDIKAKNAHPFRRGTITLVHNGTIWNFESLKKKLTDDVKFEVDSDLCANLMHAIGEKETIQELSGAFAFIWHNSKDRALKFVRNEQRPLYMLKTTGLVKQFYLASEEATLSWLAKKRNLQGDITNVPSMVLHSIGLDSGEISTELVKKYEYQGYNQNYGNYGSWPGMGTDYEDEELAAWDEYGKHQKELEEKEEKEKKKTKEGKKNVFPITNYSKEKTKLVVGDKIRWGPSDFKETIKNKRGGKEEEQQYILIGEHIADSKVAVHGLFTGNIEEMFSEHVLEGEIASIILLDPDKSKYHVRVFVKNISPVKEPQSEDLITLFDESRITRRRYFELAGKGCGICSSLIKIEQAQFVVLKQMTGDTSAKDRMICPDCVSKGRHKDS